VKDLPYTRIVVDERTGPADDPIILQPFLIDEDHGQPPLSLDWLEKGQWSAFMSREGTALALSQVTAAHILPPLLDLPTGVDLLNYRVALRDRLDPVLVRELALILEHNWRELGWEQVGPTTFLCVIGAGAATCIETRPGKEQLYLRYASSLANELFHAGHAVDTLRSRLFLQTTLYEKVNELLTRLRCNCWDWV
jgi:hypothetical protein